MMNSIDEYFGGNSGKLGTMVVGAALNLLFFSPTYRDDIHAKIKETLKDDKSKTYFFSVNTNVFKDLVKGLEDPSDNLMYSRTDKPMILYLRIVRMKGVAFVEEEVKVPLSREVLEEVKREAEKGKRNLIPTLSKI